MSGQDETGLDGLPLPLARRCHEVCTRFEDAWQEATLGGERPRIEDYLEGWSGSSRSALARELIALDVFYRRAAGERPQRADYQGRFAGLGGTWLVALCASPGEGTAAAAPASLPGRLGDFLLLREIGRGGMGIVFEAEQVSLGRRVAVKILPSTAALDPRQLQRFKTEAQAAAHLHHDHIVPVYAVGSEHGIHYYAMQRIEGQTLASLIEELRCVAACSQRTHVSPGLPADGGLVADTAPTAPAGTVCAESEGSDTVNRLDVLLAATGGASRGPELFRRLAYLGIQAAEALEHAHQLGIVHRDVKPGNFLVDREGRLWVTDFGLARVQSAAGLTATGDVLGTLRYMSPEQALARRGIVDHRTDIYSLGITLYELLTLHPAFEGDDRQELLRQITFDEPRRPRRLNPGVPADLETIVLKAMAKCPEERYATAQELAEDLARFRAGEPIRARLVPAWQRAGKWARRYPAAASLLLLVFLVATLGLPGVSWLWRRAEAARGAEASAVAQLDQAYQRERRNSYFGQIARADLEWRMNNVPQAAQLLATCPPELRHWEWGYLQRLCTSSLLTLRRHTAGVRGIALSRDGKYLGTAGEDGCVRLWEAATGRYLRELRAGSPVLTLAFSPDGQRLAAAGGDWTLGEPCGIKVWDVTTGLEVQALQGHQNAVTSVVFTPDGRYLVSGGFDRMVRVWGAQRGRLLRTLQHTGAVKSVAISPDGQRIAAGCYGGHANLRLWELSTGRVLLTASDETGDILGLAFSPDGKCLLSGSWGKAVRVWDTGTGKRLLDLREHEDVVWSVAYHPGGTHFATGSQDKTARVWDARTGKEVFTLRGHTGGVCAVLYTPGGAGLLTGAEDATVHLWPVSSDPYTRVIAPVQGHTRGLAFSPDGQRLALATWTSPHKKRLGSLQVWDLVSNRLAFPAVQRLGGFQAVAFSPDGQMMVSDYGPTIQLWDASTGRRLRVLRGHTGAVKTLAFHPGSALLASGSDDREIRIWDLGEAVPAKRDPFPCRVLARHSGEVMQVAFSPDGTRLVSASADGTVRLWDTSSGQEMLVLTGHAGAVNQAAFQRVGGRVASAGTDGTVRLWDAHTGQELLRLAGHVGPVTGLAFSADGRRLVSAGVDGNVRLWDASTGQEALTLRRPLSRVATIALSPDNQLLAAGDLSFSRLLLWEAASDQEGESDARRRSRLLGWWSREAQGCGQLQRWQASEQFLSHLIEADPSDGLSRARRAWTRAQLGDWDGAECDSAAAVQLKARLDDLNGPAYQVIWLRALHGDQAGCRQACAPLLHPSPVRFDAHRNYLAARIGGLAPDAAEDPAVLVSLAQRAVAAAPHKGDYLHALGVAHYRAGQFREAVRRLEESLRDPLWRGAFAASHFVLAMAHHRRGEGDAARDWLERGLQALPHGPPRPPVHVHDWMSCHLLRREAELLILGETEHVSRVLPLSAGAAFPRELEAWDRALALDPEDAGARGARGEVYARHCLWDEALADLSRAVELRPDLWRAWKDRGQVWTKRECHDLAVADYTEALERGGHVDAETWFYRARAHVRTGRWTLALDDAAKAVDLDPGMAFYQNLHAWLLATCPEASLRDPARAVQAAQRAVAIQPQVGAFWNTLGVAHYRAGSAEAARNALVKAMELRRGGNSVDWFFLAMISWQQGQRAEAYNWYTQAVLWMDQHQPEDGELLRFRMEAASLLELTGLQAVPSATAIPPSSPAISHSLPGQRGAPRLPADAHGRDSPRD